MQRIFTSGHERKIKWYLPLNGKYYALFVVNLQAIIVDCTDCVIGNNRVLNKRSESVNKCRHQNKCFVKNVKLEGSMELSRKCSLL